MIASLIGDRPDEERTEVRGAEQLDAEIEVERRHHHARPERDPIEPGAIASGDGREHGRSEHNARGILEFENVDEVVALWKPLFHEGHGRPLPYEKFVRTAANWFCWHRPRWFAERLN